MTSILSIFVILSLLFLVIYGYFHKNEKGKMERFLKILFVVSFTLGLCLILNFIMGMMLFPLGELISLIARVTIIISFLLYTFAENYVMITRPVFTIREIKGIFEMKKSIAGASLIFLLLILSVVDSTFSLMPKYLYFPVSFFVLLTGMCLLHSSINDEPEIFLA
ncbi:MAG TPA: hypothetical protein VJB11_00600 [archaeon]|nr:hypothetical protein [archaeon]